VVNNAHGFSIINVILVAPGHHNGISAFLPSRNSGCGGGVHPGLCALIPGLVFLVVSEVRDDVSKDTYLLAQVVKS